MFLKPSVGTDAAFKDLTFLQNMITYKNFAPTFAERTFKERAKLKCFLSEETVVFALFNDYSELANKKKRKLMEKVYKKHLASRSDYFSRGIPDCSRAITIDHATELYDIIRPESWVMAVVTIVKCERGRVVRSVVFATAMIAKLMVQLPPTPRCCVLG